MPDSLHTLGEAITTDVRRALAEDVGTGDLTAALLPEGKVVQARLLTRQDAVLCGTEWFNRAVEALDPDAEVFWHHADGDEVVAGTSLCEMQADARALLTAERTAINFVQLLPAVATRTRTFVKLVQGTRARILDTGIRRHPVSPGLHPGLTYSTHSGWHCEHSCRECSMSAPLSPRPTQMRQGGAPRKVPPIGAEDPERVRQKSPGCEPRE